MPFSHCPISRSAFGHHRRQPPQMHGRRDCHHFWQEKRWFSRQVAWVQTQRSRPKLDGGRKSSAGNGVNGSLILSRSSSAECLMDVFSLRGGFTVSSPHPCFMYDNAFCSPLLTYNLQQQRRRYKSILWKWCLKVCEKFGLFLLQPAWSGEGAQKKQ